MKQSRERSPRSLRITATLFQASTALAIPLLRALAKPPIRPHRRSAGLRRHGIHPCPDHPAAHPTRNVLSHSDLRHIDNQALIYLSALLHERLDGSLPGIALPIASSAPDTSPPPFREIVDLVSNGYGRGRTVGPPPRAPHLRTGVRSEPRPHTHRGQNSRTRRDHALKFNGVPLGGLRAR